jgi:hypothetical protein
MRPAEKKYSNTYKKRVDVERDTYLPRLSPKEIIRCCGCGAFYHRRHWMLTPPAGFRSPVGSHAVYCPACKKIKDNYPFGEVELRGVDSSERREVISVMRNEEERAREKNPLERIMSLQTADGGWKVETTTEKLAQRLGRSVKKARGGKVFYKWSHNNKFVRVVWERGTP